MCNLSGCLFLKTVVIFSLISFRASAQEKTKSDPPIETIAQLRTAIEKVLKDTRTPAVGIAMVNEKGPVWIAGIGKADVEKNIDADSTTMFRIGSTSKMFVSLSILKLQEEGKVSLNDKVKDLVPELAFENKWESTDPILVAHLLEHTTGWDDIHLAEYAHNDPVPISVKDGLAYHPHSRVSRWVPGTRMSYCNSGPPVAALIVEKITGKPFEEYVQENFFKPMGMTSMTYLRSETYQQKGATLYLDGKPQPYWNIILRPSGAINASPIDMAKMVRFFVNGAAVDTTHLISKASLQRMETPTTTSAAMLAGMTLQDGTEVLRRIALAPAATGANFSVGYVVRLPDGREAFLKAIDFSRAMAAPDPARERRLPAQGRGSADPSPRTRHAARPGAPGCAPRSRAQARKEDRGRGAGAPHRRQSRADGLSQTRPAPGRSGC